MRKELLKPVMSAIFSLLLIGLIKIVAFFILKQVNNVYFYIDLCLSLAVVIVLLRLMIEFNHRLEIINPEYHQVRSIVKWVLLLMIILTLYGTFSIFSGMPYGSYHLIFFILTLIPVYSLWKILYKHSDMLPDILRNVLSEEIIECSCGWKNPMYAKFCSKCGSPLTIGIQK